MHAERADIHIGHSSERLPAYAVGGEASTRVGETGQWIYVALVTTSSASNNHGNIHNDPRVESCA